MRKASFFLALLALLPGCGGGGGGGGSGSQGMRILHGGIDSAPFLLTSSNEEAVLQTAKFASAERYFGIPGGDQIISATSVKGSPVFSFAVPKERPARQTILIYGSRTVSGVHANLIADETDKIPADMSAVRAVHGVEKIGRIDVSAGGAAVGQGVSLGGASPYVMVPSGVQEVVVRESSRGGVLYRGAVEFAPKKAYSVFAAGEGGYLVVARITED